jgi:hypothetical protein
MTSQGPEFHLPSGGQFSAAVDSPPCQHEHRTPPSISVILFTENVAALVSHHADS